MDHSSSGDPEGRRVARKRAALLSEAGQVARALEVLMARAGYPSAKVAEILKELAAQEHTELQRGYGRLESRTRFKTPASHPLLDHLPPNLLYVDESGKSFPEPKQPDANFFALGAVSLDNLGKQDYEKRADAVKQAFFGRTNFALHEPFMRQRYQDPKSRIDYGFNRNAARQAEFDAAIAKLIADTDFVMFGVAIRKAGFATDFVATGIDPYLPTDVYTLAIMMLLERYVDMLAHVAAKQTGRLTFESQGPKEDAYHQLEYARVLLEGSQWVPDSAFRGWLETGLRFAPKEGSHPCELADFLSRDLFEWVRSGCTVSPKWWSIYCAKVYVRGDGLLGKFGVKVFPDSDIRDRVIQHRKDCGAN